MAIVYKKLQRRNPADPEAPKKWYASLKSIRVMKEKEVAMKIADETTLNPMEAQMAMYQFQKVVIEALTDGKTVTFGELGTFRLTASSEGTETEEKVTPDLIKKLNIRFVPSKNLKKRINEATYLPIEKFQ